MSATRHLMLVLGALSACQSKSDAGARPAGPTPIELVDAKGHVVARVIAAHPCRALVDDMELLIGTDPLVAQNGDARWTGTTAANGTTLKRNDEVIARVFPVDKPDEVGLYTPDGVAMFRATLVGDKADLVSGAGAVIGTVKKLPSGAISLDSGLAGERKLVGSNDLLLAALLGANEAPPEVRGLAACHRLFPSPNGL